MFENKVSKVEFQEVGFYLILGSKYWKEERKGKEEKKSSIHIFCNKSELLSQAKLTCVPFMYISFGILLQRNSNPPAYLSKALSGYHYKQVFTFSKPLDKSSMQHALRMHGDVRWHQLNSLLIEYQFESYFVSKV